MDTNEVETAISAVSSGLDDRYRVDLIGSDRLVIRFDASSRVAFAVIIGME